MNIFSLINAMRKDLTAKRVSMEAAFSFLDDLEECACEMSNEIVGLKASSQQSGNCFVNLNKDSKYTAVFCRQYHLHGVHAGNIHYMVECFTDKNYGNVSNIVDGLNDFIASRFIEEKTPSKNTYGCMKLNTSDGRVLINSASVEAITECKRKYDVIAVIHLKSGKQFDTDLSYETVASAYLDYLGKERGTIKRPVGI